VIGVDPDRQGTGLGRALVVAGLSWLHEHGTPVGMLYVDAANEPALALYRAIGFEIARHDRAYSRDLA
jgi:mycothiol synthase